MFISPTNSVPKPMSMVPAVVADLDPINIIRIMPAISAIGARLSDLKKYRMLDDPALTSISLIICAVIVVPTLAPSTIPIDCLNVRKPAPTRPTVSTIAAVELWIIHVTTNPRRKPLNGLSVTLASAAFIAPPEVDFRPSPMMRIP